MAQRTKSLRRAAVISAIVTVLVMGSVYIFSQVYANDPPSNNFFVRQMQEAAATSFMKWLGMTILGWVIVTTITFILSPRGKNDSENAA